MGERVVTEPTTVRHNAGRCPACGAGLWAEVDLVTEIHPPRLDQQGKPQHCAHASAIGARITHVCERDIDGEWTWTDGDA